MWDYEAGAVVIECVGKLYNMPHIYLFIMHHESLLDRNGQN